MDNAAHDISWLVEASKYVDLDLQITIGLRQALFLTLLPDTFTTQHALLIGCLLHISPAWSTTTSNTSSTPTSSTASTAPSTPKPNNPPSLLSLLSLSSLLSLLSLLSL